MIKEFNSQPPSEARTAANRANAQLSTGPKTATGRQNSSKNATKHGLSAASRETLPEIWKEEYTNFEESLLAELQPETSLENVYFMDYSLAKFLHAKAALQEAATFAAFLAQPSDPTLDLAHTRATRYVNLLERRARQALAALQDLQVNRHLAAEIESLAQAEYSAAISVPAAAPLRQLLAPHHLRVSPSEVAYRFVLSQTKIQNEPKSDSEPGSPPPER